MKRGYEAAKIISKMNDALDFVEQNLKTYKETWEA
jgi:hypothetical protein